MKNLFDNRPYTVLIYFCMKFNKYKTHLLDKINILGLMAIVFLVPLVYTSKAGEVALYSKFQVLSAIVSFLTIIWLIKLITQKVPLSFSTPLTLPIIYFLVINIVSLNAAINIHASLFPIVQLINLSILFFLTVNNISKKGIYLILRTWVLVGGIVSIIGIGQYLGLGFEWIPSAGNPSSTFAYRNMAAMFLILTLPVAGFLFSKSRRIRNEILWGVVTTLLMIFLIYTRTRGAWLGLIGTTFITSIVIMWLRRTRGDLLSNIRTPIFSKRKRIMAISFFLVISFMASLEPNIKVKSFGGSKAEIISTAFSIFNEKGDSGRLGLWQASMKMFKDDLNWLTGVGLNNWQFVYPYYSGPEGPLGGISSVGIRPHNDYLWILTETGVLGLGIYLWLLFTVGRMIYIILKRCKNTKTVHLTITYMTSLLAILIHAMFSFPKERIAISILFWLILAFISYEYKNLNGNSTDTKIKPFNSLLMLSKQPTKRQGILLVVLLTIISLGSLEIGRRHLFSDYHLKRGIFYLKRNDYPSTIRELNQAQQLWYNSWKFTYVLGITHLKLQDFPSSISSFKRCLTYSPYSLMAHYSLGITYFKNSNFQEALKHFTFTILIDPKFANGYYNLGFSWQNLGNDEEAEKNYQLSLVYDPQIAKAYNNLGAIFKNREEYENAQIYFEKALDIQPDLKTATQNLESLNELKSYNPEK